MHQSQDRAIGEFLYGLYLEIRPLEERHQVMASAWDLRPRVEHYHDAVRAWTAQDASALQPGGRLSVEQLAQDIQGLRAVKELPIPRRSALRGQTPSYRDLPARPEDIPPADPADRRRDAATLSGLYERYTIMFAAAVAGDVEAGFRDRIEELDALVEEMAEFSTLMKSERADRMDAHVPLEQVLGELYEYDLREHILAFLRQKREEEKQKILAMLSTMPVRDQIDAVISVADKTIAGLDKAHMAFLSSQMIIYQEGQDLVKKLAAQGLNVAGRFTESAAGRAAGRGQGTGR